MSNRKEAIEERIADILDRIDDANLKEDIRSFWTSDFYDYLEKIDHITKNIESKSIDVDEAYSTSKEITDNLLSVADGLEVRLDSKLIAKKMKQAFRDLSGPWGYQGKILKRAYEKPRGYPGDYLMIESIYDSKTVSEGIGYCSDMYFLNNEYANAVRNRKDLMKDMLIDFLKSSNNDTINILNIACGSCREITDIVSKDVNFAKDINFKLVDHDEEALTFSKKALKIYQTDKITFEFLKHNVLEYTKNIEEYSSILGKQDLIYSIGLADYLPDRLLKNLLSFWYKLLKPNGKIMLAHKDRLQYKPVPIDWWADWTFYSRDEKALIDLLNTSGIDGFDLEIKREKSNIIFFLVITKKG